MNTPITLEEQERFLVRELQMEESKLHHLEGAANHFKDEVREHKKALAAMRYALAKLQKRIAAKKRMAA